MTDRPEVRRARRAQILNADLKPHWVVLFAAKLKLDRGLSGCGRWLGASTGSSDRHDGRPAWYGLSAAKVAWVMRNREPWPEGHHAAHLCRNRECVNPLHVLPMTPDEHYEYDRNHEGHEWSEHERPHQTDTGHDGAGATADPLPVPY